MVTGWDGVGGGVGVGGGGVIGQKLSCSLQHCFRIQYLNLTSTKIELFCSWGLDRGLAERGNLAPGSLSVWAKQSCASDGVHNPGTRRDSNDS